MSSPISEDHQLCLNQLLDSLKGANYAFNTPTPETHQIVLDLHSKHGQARGDTLTDLLGWSLPCDEEAISALLPQSLIDSLSREGILSETSDKLYKSSYRVSSLYTKPNSQLYLHSAFPPNQNSVFFGPDSYRFLDYLDAHLPALSIHEHSITVDVCTGGGAGVQALLSHFSNPAVGLDINDLALSLARINIPDSRATFLNSSLLDKVKTEQVSLIVGNPPYIAGTNKPTYASGGKEGLGITFQIVEQAKEVLIKGGKLVIYTGVSMSFKEPMRDILRERLEGDAGWKLIRYDILDVDVFANDIGQPGYEEASRTQVIGCIVEKV